MNSELSKLKPSRLWNHFERLCAIPHPSKHEEKIAKYLADFGRGLGLETTVDQVGNVIIRKPATPGMEKVQPVCLQAHMDMVPQKNADVKHDFLNDPIRPRVDGSVVRATGTTLGADNGIGVAAILAVLEAKDLKHGPIEALITIDEEAGMTGAKNLKPGLFKANFMLNLDSESEDELCVGCAGGIDTTIFLPAPREKTPSGFTGFELKISGLRGGHSGVDIGLGRGNSNILMARLLSETLAEADGRIAAMNGGDLRNVIPRETRATVAVAQAQAEKFRKRFEEEGNAIRREFAAADPEIRVECKPTDIPAEVIRKNEGQRIARSIYACPNGMAFMTSDMPDLVETSSNIGAVKTEGDQVKVITLQRSSVDTRKIEMAHRVAAVFEMAGAKVEHSNPYSGWNPNMKSPLLAKLVEIYGEHFGHKPEIKATHGGLECGIIMGAYPKLDAVSMGPNLHFPHSPDEHVEIESVARFWDYLVKVLERIPA